FITEPVLSPLAGLIHIRDVIEIESGIDHCPPFHFCLAFRIKRFQDPAVTLQDTVHLTEVSLLFTVSPVIVVAPASIIAELFIGSPYEWLTAVQAHSLHRCRFCLSVPF